MLVLELVLTPPMTRFPASLGKKLDGGEIAEGVGDGLRLGVIEEWPLVKWAWLKVLSVEQQTCDTFQASQCSKISKSFSYCADKLNNSAAPHPSSNSSSSLTTPPHVEDYAADATAATTDNLP